MAASGQRLGYVLVSTFDQNADRQLDGIAVDRTFLDKKSGKDVDREQREAMMAFVRQGRHSDRTLHGSARTKS